MARSAKQIEQSLRDSFTQINPSLDLKVGPTYDYTLRPIPKELARVEASVDRLLRFYSSNFSTVATPAEARDFATNFGISTSLGERASGTLVFYRNSPPPSGVTLFIPVGLVVGTIDSKYLFRTQESKLMLGDFADTYFNPQTNKYEIAVLIEAVAPGAIYNLPSQRITKIISGNPTDFAGVEQRVEMSGGSEPETTAELAARVIQQFKGINLNSITGIATLAKRFVPTGILATAIIRSTDRLEFRRKTTGPAVDLCIKGVEAQVFTEEYFAFGGELNIVLKTATCTSVAQVQVNSAALDTSLWTYLPDISPELQGSTRARPSIEFVNALTKNDVVDFIGVQNLILDKVQAVVETGDDAIFKTDILVRSFVNLPIVVGLELKLKNSVLVNAADVESAIASYVQGYIEPIESVPSVLLSNDLVAFLRANIPDVDSVRVFEFRRKYTSIDTVEVIAALKNEIPKFDSLSSRLIVRS